MVASTKSRLKQAPSVYSDHLSKMTSSGDNEVSGGEAAELEDQLPEYFESYAIAVVEIQRRLLKMTIRSSAKSHQRKDLIA